jgi:dihydrofolate reductase
MLYIKNKKSFLKYKNKKLIMKLSIIVATDLNNGIGINGKMPWNTIKKDLNFFKGKTLDNNVIMGRKTLLSIPNYFLKDRKNIVITNDMNYKPHNENVIVSHSIDDAMELCDKEKDVFIIGGRNIYGQFMDKIDKIYLTKIHDIFQCDTYFPELDDNWFIDYESPIFEEEYKIQFLIYKRKQNNEN